MASKSKRKTSTDEKGAKKKKTSIEDLLPLQVKESLGDLYFGRDLSTTLCNPLRGLCPNLVLGHICFHDDLNTVEKLRPNLIWRHLSSTHKDKSRELRITGGGMF